MSTELQRLPIFLAEALEKTLNGSLRLDSDHGASIKALPECIITLQILPLKTPFYCLINEQQISVQTHLQGESDASISAQAADWIALKHAKDLSCFELDGNRDLAQQFLHALAAIDIDWEEHLSKITGDLIAFKVGHGVRSYMQLKRDQRDYIMQTLKEYLQFELQAVPSKPQIAAFSQEVSAVEQRLQELEQRFNQLDASSVNR
ncbi:MULTISPECIES: SCP2 domain-containing protein [Thiomicrorhabdus]|uniref:Ubiquinone biosynthesis accessory factor UbiJ n=1 Tax=Thiomicrorhabdus xiamenensis TaxID=2739063 RepID=A0A7D4NSF0_9GAMM|nr:MULTISPECIES: SCP2 sterol-binding domain-containing protein [Thiomicrorhabdus]MBO1923125.1 SCP2 sterol-binding domain-containing protein [Thiomicrorhabdus sp. 6S3-12]QKI89897.1 SCP2 sterol-binding domain-containing protein [Thiomicrorhabdus xiamenensis]